MIRDDPTAAGPSPLGAVSDLSAVDVAPPAGAAAVAEAEAGARPGSLR